MKDSDSSNGTGLPGGLSTGIRRPLGTNGGKRALPASPAPPPAPRGRFSRLGVTLAFLVAVIVLPLQLRYQFQRRSRIEERQYRMEGVNGRTEAEVTRRFGKPAAIHYFPMSEGSMTGPDVGLKRYYRLNAPDYGKRTEGAEVEWRYPEFITIRELAWRLPDSVLTVWLREPRAEIDLSKPDEAEIAMADAGKGDWIVLDNYRIGNDLLKKMPAQAPR